MPACMGQLAWSLFCPWAHSQLSRAVSPPVGAAHAAPPGMAAYALLWLGLSSYSLPLIWNAKTILYSWQKALDHFHDSCYRLVVLPFGHLIVWFYLSIFLARLWPYLRTGFVSLAYHGMATSNTGLACRRYLINICRIAEWTDVTIVS